MTVGAIIKLKGISKRGKDRINSHGEEFKLIKLGGAPLLQGNENSILVESLGNTWRGEKWLGWFENGVEIEVIA